MDQPDRNVEEIARIDLDRLYLGLQEIKSEPSRHDESIEVACSMMMPTGLGLNCDLRLAEQDLLGLESPLSDDPLCSISPL